VANVRGTFQNCTLAAKKAAVTLSCLIDREKTVAEPIFVQSKDCVFLNPFLSGPHAGVFLTQPSPMRRGLILWRADGDVFDRRLHYVAAPMDPGPPKDQRQDQTEWGRLWGSPGVSGLTLDLELSQQTLDIGEWALTLDKLSVPAIKVTGMKDRPVGAKLADLPLLKKPKRP